MINTVQNIAKLGTGVYQKPTVGGSVYYIQSRDFDDYLEMKTDLRPELQEDHKLQNHYLKTEDILITAKGENYRAYVFKNEVSPAVASSTFIVLRDINAEKINPAYVAWFINHPRTQLYLSTKSKGSNIPYISKSVIAELEINIPSIDIQNRILEIQQLRTNEKKLMERINNLKETMINEKLIQAI